MRHSTSRPYERPSLSFSFFGKLHWSDEDAIRLMEEILAEEDVRREAADKTDSFMRDTGRWLPRELT